MKWMAYFFSVYIFIIKTLYAVSYIWNYNNNLALDIFTKKM